MNIAIGDSGHYIQSDEMNLILCEKKVRQKGANAGKDYYDTIGYYGTMSQLLKALVEKRILDSTAETVEQLRADIKAVHDMIDDLLKGCEFRGPVTQSDI